MQYRVIYPFMDLKDEDKTIYQKGDSYPRKGLKVTKTRVNELSGKKNKIGKKLIEPIEKEVENVKSRKSDKGD